MAGTLAGLGFLPVEMTKSFVSEESVPLLDLFWSGCGCCDFQFIVFARHGSTKSWPNKSPDPLAPGF